MSGPVRLLPDAEAIPDALKERKQWICWRTELRDGDTTKVPVNPSTDGMASSTDASTWAAFDDAWSHYNESACDGVGFVFTDDGPFAGVDLDGCRDPDTKEIEEWARDILATLDTYSEVSPSGTGVHALGRAEVPASGNRKGDVEIYDSARYFTVTGKHLGETPPAVKDRQDALDAVHAEHVASDDSGATAVDENPGGTSTAGDLEDAELLETAKNAANGEKFRRLWNGDKSGYPSHSEADLALCDLLAFYTGPDPGRIDRLFRRSGLMREKWERDDYRERTIKRAIDGTDEFYEPPGAGPDDADGRGGAGGESDEPTWPKVRSLFGSDANGTTTKAYNRAARLICRDREFVKVRESGGFYYYDPEAGYYIRKGETFLEEILNGRLGEHANENRRREIRRRVEGENYLSSDEFHPPEGKVNVEDGVLDLESRSLEEHTSDYYFTSKVRANWDVDLDPGAIEIWTGALEDATDDENERKKIEEFVGYALETWHHDREKNLFLVGPRLSGKSSIQEAVEALFGTQPTVTNLTPQQIADTKFDAAALREAALNTKNDINARKIEDTGTLKGVFSGERMKLENKYEDAHFAAPKAKHLFTANWLPRLVGQDDAVYRRILLVEFTKTIEDHERDRGYKKRLKRQDVRDVIFARAVDARDRLHEQDGFTNDRSPNDTRRMWDSWRDGHKRFLYTQFEITGDPEDLVDKRSYWQAYREFAARKGYELKSNRAVTDSLQWVPEVYTNGDGDEYGGLKWRHFDAADPGADGRLTDFDQETKVKQVRSIVRELSSDEAVGREVVVEAATESGLAADDVEHVLENLLTSGELYEPETGMVAHV